MGGRFSASMGFSWMISSSSASARLSCKAGVVPRVGLEHGCWCVPNPGAAYGETPEPKWSSSLGRSCGTYANACDNLGRTHGRSETEMAAGVLRPIDGVTGGEVASGLFWEAPNREADAAFLFQSPANIISMPQTVTVVQVVLTLR